MPGASDGGFHFKVIASLLTFHFGGKMQVVLSSKGFIVLLGMAAEVWQYIFVFEGALVFILLKNLLFTSLVNSSFALTFYFLFL